MGARKTPIEHLAAGDSLDKNRRYVERMRAAGFTRRAEWIPLEYVAEFKAFVRHLAEQHGRSGPRADD